MTACRVRRPCGKQFGVSRMTVNRAVKELAVEGVVSRVQDSGTVAARAEAAHLGLKPADPCLAGRSVGLVICKN